MATCFTSVPVRSLDRDGVGAAERGELDMLDAVEVHGDVADVAEQPHPLAIGRDVDVLVDVGAVEHQRIGAGLPSTVSLPSPGFQTKVSLPLPSSATSLPRPPLTVSLPSPPISVSLPWLPVMVSLPAPPSIVRPMTPAARPAALMTSLPATAVDDELVVGALGAGEGDRRRQAGDRDRASRCPPPERCRCRRCR